MSEEEKAIDTLKEVASDDFDTLGDDISPKMAQNILNVIDKQQKDIEEKNIAINKMSKDISHQLKEIEELKKIPHISKVTNKYLSKFYIHKNKIRLKIKEVQETMCPNCCACGLCDEFKELLEEN